MSAKRTATVAALVASVALVSSAAGQMISSAPSATAPTASANSLAAARVNHFLGTVGTSNRSHHWFTMRTTSNRSVRIYTAGRTTWHGCGWGNMRRGFHVDVRVYSYHGAWYASMIRYWSSWDHHGGSSGYPGMGGSSGRPGMGGSSDYPGMMR